MNRKKRRRRETEKQQKEREAAKRRKEQRQAASDALFNLAGFILFLIIMAILLSSCVMPPSNVPSALPGDPGFAGLAAQATGTSAAAEMMATRTAMQATAQAAAAAQNAAMTATSESIEATRASVLATATMQAQETAQAQATAAQFQQSREEIALAAEGTRAALQTEATATATYLIIKDDVARSERAEWFWIGFLIILLLALAWVGYGIGKLIHRNAVTVRDADGTVVVYRNQVFLPSSTLPAAAANPGRFATHNNQDGAHGVDLYRPPKRLEDERGDLVYEFSGRQLDQMTINIQNGDIGFRRNKSGLGEGLDTLIGLSNGSLFSKVLDEMKRLRFVEAQGSGNVWTRRGMIDFLEMNTLPHPG